MKKFLALIAFVLFTFAASVNANAQKSVHVKSYTTKKGKHVKAHNRSRPKHRKTSYIHTITLANNKEYA